MIGGIRVKIAPKMIPVVVRRVDAYGGKTGYTLYGTKCANHLEIFERNGINEMPNKEYIERGSLIAELQEELDFYPLLHTREYNDGFNAGLKRALRLVKSQTAADVVEVRHGEWIIKTDDYDNEYMMCSCCKDEFYPVDEDTVDFTPNYCQTCGAKMDGERREQA